MVETRDGVDPDTVRAVFKAYDVRGLVPVQIDESLARATGRAHVQVTEATMVVVGHDMRPSSPGLDHAFATGATEAGADVVMIGLASTDMLYFASGHLGVAGAMFTASHNPAQYNGIKLCRANAVPLGLESGLDEIRDLVIAPRPSVVRPLPAGCPTRPAGNDTVAAQLRSSPDLSTVSDTSNLLTPGSGVVGWRCR